MTNVPYDAYITTTENHKTGKYTIYMNFFGVRGYYESLQACYDDIRKHSSEEMKECRIHLRELIITKKTETKYETEYKIKTAA